MGLAVTWFVQLAVYFIHSPFKFEALILLVVVSAQDLLWFLGNFPQCLVVLLVSLILAAMVR